MQKTVSPRRTFGVPSTGWQEAHSNMENYLDITPRVRKALHEGRPVVALESTVIAHGLPWPQNLETALAMEAAVTTEGAEPATVALSKGRIRIGLDEEEIKRIAQEEGVVKTSRRDIATVLASGTLGATTVGGTLACASLAGIRVMATGGIGGVHAGGENSLDISADLPEIARSNAAVVCSGVKSILDLARTLEVLETLGVPVVGFGTDELPAFYSRESRFKVDARANSPEEVTAILKPRFGLSLGGVIVANPIPESDAIENSELDGWTRQALAEAEAKSITGNAVTPFLLKRLVELSEGRTLQANIALLKNNAALAARIASALTAG